MVPGGMLALISACRLHFPFLNLFSFHSYYDNLSAKQCHGKRLPCNVNDTSICVTQEDVNRPFD